MSDENEVRARRDHVALTEVSVQKITRWFEQINAKKKIRISRKNLVNWLIEKLPDNLSGSDLAAVIERFYDEERFLRQLLREVREAKANGTSESMELIVRPKRPDVKKEPSEFL